MNSMMTGQPATAETPGTGSSGETEIARYLAQADPVDVLVASGYLAGHDGNLIARRLRRPQLRQALEHSVCHAVAPDPDCFYQGDEEPDSNWRRRRAATIRDHCAICPVRAACAELALRDDDPHGVRGGLTQHKLALRLKTEHERLATARADDTRAARDQNELIQAATDVQRIAQQYMGSSVPAGKRAENKAAILSAVERRDTLRLAHRAQAGWEEAA
ncbi:WhiB family transcriptional regulator [Streptomyces sp. OfavH-34-F]|uniref:WhiB family transcriptional regulator n=1 Tax=Streptomyces sp. OfavH-34-F TaxID=2917760 RepID=UPI001EF1AF74|nr:WhiB family transcriptional regulator [Streptomyces sp. OfavH-34-F]MCG7524042.1 WhiB family transcriptional regulator [Streptomyces sp. OfavH-34-F]